MDGESGVEWMGDGSARVLGVSELQQEILRLTGDAIARVDFFKRLNELLMGSAA